MPATVYIPARLTELKTAATAGLTLARTGNAIPSRIYTSHGPPIPDFCTDNGLLAVYLDNPAIGEDKPSIRKAESVGPTKRMPILRMGIDLWRCVPNLDQQGTPPSSAVLTASAEALANDMWALDTYLRANKLTLFPTGLASTVIPNFADVVPLSWANTPGGNVAGWRWKVTVPISDGGP